MGAVEHIAASRRPMASLVAIYLCFRMTEPFLPPLTWAVALALVGRPIHRWIARYVKNPHMAAGISAALVGIALLVPILFAGQHLVSQTAEGIEAAQEVSQSGSWREKVEQYPRLVPLIRWIDSNKDAQAEITKAIS